MKVKNNVANNNLDISLAADGTAVIKQLKILEAPTSPKSVATKEYVDNRLDISNSSPGNMIFRPFKSTPTGYLKCNGGEVNKQTYPALYAAIGETFSKYCVPGAGQPYRHQYDVNVSLSQTLSSDWNKPSTLPVTNTYIAIVITKNRVYIFSRYNGTSYTNGIYTCPINNDGTLGTWTTAPITMPMPLSYSQAVVANNYVYFLAGYNGVHRNNVYRAAINSDGTLNPFEAHTNLPEPVSHSKSIVTKNKIYLIAGYVNSVPSNKVYVADLDNAGNITSWSLGPSLPVDVVDHLITVIKDKVYVIGGITNGVHSDDIYCGTLNLDGTIDSWEHCGKIPATITSSGILCSRNRLYLFGGLINGVPSDKIYSAAINIDGTLAGWEAEGTLPDTSYAHQIVATSGRICLIGGIVNGSISSRINQINALGGINDYSYYYGTDVMAANNETFRIPDYSFLENLRLYAYIKY